MNNKNILMLIISILIAFNIWALITGWGIRQEMVYYKNWKETYDSRYCPTCGQPLNIKSEVLEDGNNDR